MEDSCPMSEQINAFGRVDEAQGHWSSKPNYEGQTWNKGSRSAFQPRPFVHQQNQNFSNYSKPYSS